MNYTSIEQSKKLLELGLGAESADMFYMMYMDGEKPCNGDENLRNNYQDKQGNWYSLELYEEYFEEECFKENGVYAWSCGALLKLLPEVIGEMDLYIETISGKWYIGYKNSDGAIIGQFSDDEPLELIYKCLVWLLENNYLNKIWRIKW